jgi:hypothetical protein
MAADAFDRDFKGKPFILLLQPKPSRWAAEARRLSELLARPSEQPPEKSRSRPFEDLDSIWRDEEPLHSW